MFRRQESTLHPDASYEASLEDLGYFIDNKGCFRDIEAPELFYKFHCTNDDRHNEVRGEAMRACHRREVLKRLAALGLTELYLPTLSYKKPSAPHIPILAPAAEVLKARKRIIVVINDDAYQDLGILAYRELQREGGVNGGSIINFVKGLIGRARGNADYNLEEKLAVDGAGVENAEHVPGIVILNNGQLLYSHKYNRALSRRSWDALPRKSIAHDSVKIHEVENRVEGHRTPEEHIKTVFEKVINNSEFVSPDAEVYVVAIENGVDNLITVLNEDFARYAGRITALAAIQSRTSGSDILSPEVKTFLHTRARHWQTSLSSPDPGQCNALPPYYKSQATSRVPKHKMPIDWLEKGQVGIGDRANTPYEHGSEAKAAINPPTKVSFDAGFIDITPLCPTFGGGDAWTGECVFTQPIVQQAVLNFFEDVAQDPEGFCNPEFNVSICTPAHEDSLDATMINPEKQALLAAEEELSQMQAGLHATPGDDPAFSLSVLRLQKRIAKKEAEITVLKEKALAVGALSADDAQESRGKRKNRVNDQLCGSECADDHITFAGVQAPSNVAASTGCSSTVDEEFARSALNKD